MSTPSHRQLARPWRVLLTLGSLLVALAGIGLGLRLAGVIQPAGSQPSHGLTSIEDTFLPGSPAIVPVPPRPEAVIPLGRSHIRVPVLEYHYIRVVTDPYDRLGFNLSVTPLNFAIQMDWLTRHGYHPINLADLRAYFAGLAPLPARPVVLTFDDGYQNFYIAAEPILQAYGFKAVAYIVPGFWGNRAYMTPDELTQLDRSGLVQIGSHTVDHVNLTHAGPAQVNYQLRASKSMLERLLGHPVVDFCYPTGRFDDLVIAAVGNAGYLTATTQVPGTTLVWSNRLAWPRVKVLGGETLATFVANLGTPEPTVEPPAPPTRPAAPHSRLF